MHFSRLWLFLSLSITGERCVLSLYCYDCQSLDQYDEGCVKLKGRGRDNTNKYYRECSSLMNSCSLFIGHFKNSSGKPSVVVWRQCDIMKEYEDECKRGPPSYFGETSGTTCKCMRDFCNGRSAISDSHSKRKKLNRHVAAAARPKTLAPTTVMSLLIVFHFWTSY